MSHDSPSLDLLPEGDPSDELSSRHTRILVALVSVLLVAGAAVVVLFLAGQNASDPGGSTVSPTGPSLVPTGPVDPSTDDEVLTTALADLDLALSTLSTAITSADGLLAGSDGKVADDTTRVALASALVSARSALDAEVDRDRLDDVQSAATRVRATTASLQHAAGSVADSHEEWLLQQQAPTQGPVAPGPQRPVDPLPVPTDEGVPGPVVPPDRTPRPGPVPIPVPDDQR